MHTKEQVTFNPSTQSQFNRDISEQHLALERLHQLANYDQLTSLPNRNLFNERIAFIHTQAIRHKFSYALFVIDLDNFKKINDTLGHLAGDILLNKVAKRLSEVLREADTLAHVGGDEFTVISSMIKDKDDVALIANKILTSLAEPFHINETELLITASIGIATYPDDTHNPDTLFKFADIAMYQAKRKGKNVVEFYSSRLTKVLFQRNELEQDLHKAIKEEDSNLALFYQPIVAIETHQITGLEALLHWQHTKHGLIPTSKVISIAEESDLMLKLGDWILRSALSQMRRWDAQGFSNFHIAVNISALQFSEKIDLASSITQLLAEFAQPADRLYLEITESLFLDDTMRIMDQLTILKELGIHLCMDDFGTGYSSLSYLQSFSFDVIKIDKSFVDGISSPIGKNTLIGAIIAMAKNLNMKLVAEGVENQDQLDFLLQHGCDFAQGFLFHQPLTTEEVTALLGQIGQKT